MVQMSLEQQQCYRNRPTPKISNRQLPQQNDEQEILFADLDAKNAAVKKLLFEVENRQRQSSSYENSYETSYEDDNSSVGDSTLTASEDGSHRWDEEKELEDPVGDMITDRLNEGSIPYFGYQNYLRLRQQQQQQGKFMEDTSFDWTHIVCVRNVRALRNMILCAWETDNNPLEGNSSLEFLQEIFLVVLVLAYAINDVVLRTASWVFMLVFMSIVHTLIDVNELHHGLVELLGSDRVRQITNGVNQCRMYWKKVMKTVHTDFLWGDYLQGRLIAWSEEERLPKFRRKHIALIHINRERKQNAKTTRRLERDIKRSRREGAIENAAETVVVNEAKLLLQNRKKEIDATTKELNRKPPTYFPASICLREDKEQEETFPNNLPRSDATMGHLEALRFCHKMVFFREREEKAQQVKEETGSTKDVSITHTTLDSVDRIEVISKDVSMLSCIVTEESDDGSTACSDFPSIVEHWNSESDDDTISYADSVSTSEQALPWLAVGAKIGEKLLKSRQLQRVVANPEAIQKSLPNEAIKLIDGMDITERANEIASDLEMKQEKERDMKQDMKQDMELLKRPVHGMWSSPGARPPAQAKARPQIQGTPTRSRFAVIEMPTSFNDTSFEPPSPPAKLVRNGLFKQPPVDRLTPIEKGVRIIVPMFSPDPNISISAKASSFYQMVSQIFVALIRLHMYNSLMNLSPSCVSGNRRFFSQMLHPIKSTMQYGRE